MKRFFGLLFGMLGMGLAHGLTMQVYQANLYDRFYVDPGTGPARAFVGDSYDWTGVGHQTNTSGLNPWATMISPSYFVSAGHLPPGGGAQITFHLDNSPTGATYVGTVDGTWSYRGNVGGVSSDLYVGRLTAPIPAGAGVAVYPILALPNPLTDYHDAELWVYGYGQGDIHDPLSDAVGRNLVNNPLGYDDVVLDVSPATPPYTSATAVLIYNYDTGSVYPSVGADEAWLQYGDSGAPTFILFDGRLALVGTHLGLDGALEADTFVPYYASQILNAIQVSDRPELVTVIVPEPAGALLLVAGVLGLLFTARTCRRDGGSGASGVP